MQAIGLRRNNKNYYLFIILILLNLCNNTRSYCQNNKQKDTIKQIPPPQILNSGFIDVVTNGQLNAAARFIHLYIGEPGKFILPMSIYTGVSSNNFQNQSTNSLSIIHKNNEQLYNNFINPLSGIANISINGIEFLEKKKESITKVVITYQFGERVLTGFKSGLINNPQTGKPINFLSGFASLGPYLQTGAWKKNNSKNVGIFWLSLRYITSITSEKSLKEILPNIQTNGIYTGYSVAWGVEINKLINMKIIFYKYLKEPEIDYSLPIYQFQFNYSMK